MVYGSGVGMPGVAEGVAEGEGVLDGVSVGGGLPLGPAAYSAATSPLLNATPYMRKSRRELYSSPPTCRVVPTAGGSQE